MLVFGGVAPGAQASSAKTYYRCHEGLCLGAEWVVNGKNFEDPETGEHGTISKTGTTVRFVIEGGLPPKLRNCSAVTLMKSGKNYVQGSWYCEEENEETKEWVPFREEGIELLLAPKGSLYEFFESGTDLNTGITVFAKEERFTFKSEGRIYGGTATKSGKAFVLTYSSGCTITFAGKTGKNFVLGTDVCQGTTEAENVELIYRGKN
jgi:hypothetical protein